MKISKKSDSKDTLILALDVEPEEARGVIRELSSKVSIFKIGNRLFTALGPRVVEWVHESGRKVFLDLKFHDIPKTVSEACRNAARMGVWGLTVHASGGFAMMEEAARALKEESKIVKKTRPLAFGVTVLTSFSDADLKSVGVRDRAQGQVRRLAKLARSSGLDGVVCSGNEIEILRKVCGKDFKLVVPGIRFGLDLAGDDQKRVMTPGRAVSLGADYLVIGRPILASPDRIRATLAILGELKGVTKQP